MSSEISGSTTHAISYAKHNKVRGWLTAGAAEVLIDLSTTLPVEGRPVCEIGVHHGKLLILLGLLTSGKVVGYDLFERQDENIDRSGCGDRRKFLLNCQRYLGSNESVDAVTSNSLELTAEEVVSDCGSPPVLFSVDGGHTAELTMNDLTIAASAVAEDGIVILDDFYNEAWPEVAFGTLRFFDESPGRLFPFCIVGNKVLMARSAAMAEQHRDFLAAKRPRDYRNIADIRTCEIFGWRVCVMRTASAPMSLRHRFVVSAFWQATRTTLFGQLVRRAFGR